MRHRKRGSLGQMISTLCFLGVGMYLIGDVAMTQDDPLRSTVLSLCAVLSLAGALRFQIAWVAARFQTV